MCSLYYIYVCTNKPPASILSHSCIYCNENTCTYTRRKVLFQAQIDKLLQFCNTLQHPATRLQHIGIYCNTHLQAQGDRQHWFSYTHNSLQHTTTNPATTHCINTLQQHTCRRRVTCCADSAEPNSASNSSASAKCSGSRKLSSAHSSCRLFCRQNVPEKYNSRWEHNVDVNTFEGNKLLSSTHSSWAVLICRKNVRGEYNTWVERNVQKKLFEHIFPADLQINWSAGKMCEGNTIRG